MVYSQYTAEQRNGYVMVKTYLHNNNIHTKYLSSFYNSRMLGFPTNQQSPQLLPYLYIALIKPAVIIMDKGVVNKFNMHPHDVKCGFFFLITDT